MPDPAASVREEGRGLRGSLEVAMIREAENLALTRWSITKDAPAAFRGWKTILRFWFLSDGLWEFTGYCIGGIEVARSPESPGLSF